MLKSILTSLRNRFDFSLAWAGEESKEEKQRELLEELYSASALGGFDPAGFLGLLPDPDPVLRKSAEGVEVLRTLSSDGKVISCVQNRKLGTLKKKDFLFEPGKEEDTEPDQAAKDVCTRLVEDLRDINLYDLISQILDAPGYGMTPVEPLYDAVDGWLHIVNLKPRPHEWFAYNENHEPVFSGDHLNEPVNTDKLVIARHFPDATNPYGLRLLSRCLWPVAIKRGGIQFWTVLCERFGMPWVIGKVEGDKEKRAAALAQLTAMVQNAVAVLNTGAEVDVHTLSGKSGDLHAGLVRYCDMDIARILQGQNLTNEGGTTGSYAESKTSKENLGDYQEADEHLVVTFFNDLAKIYTRINTRDALPPVFRYREPEDYAAIADLDGKLYNTGVRFTEEHYVRKYRLAKDEFRLESKPPEEAVQGPGKKPVAELSAGQDGITPEQAVLDRFKADLSQSATTALGNNEKILLKAILSASNYQEAMVNLLSAYPDLDAGELEDLLEPGLFNAALYGVYVEQQEGDDAD